MVSFTSSPELSIASYAKVGIADFSRKFRWRLKLRLQSKLTWPKPGCADSGSRPFHSSSGVSRKVHAVEILRLEGVGYTVVYSDFFKRHDQFAHSVQRITVAK